MVTAFPRLRVAETVGGRRGARRTGGAFAPMEAIVRVLVCGGPIRRATRPGLKLLRRGPERRTAIVRQSQRPAVGARAIRYQDLAPLRAITFHHRKKPAVGYIGLGDDVQGKPHGKLPCGRHRISVPRLLVGPDVQLAGALGGGASPVHLVVNFGSGGRGF